MSIFPTNQITRSEISPRLLAQWLLPAKTVMLYETASGKSARIERIVVANIDAAVYKITLYHVGPRASPSTANALAYECSIPANSTAILDGPFYLTAGDQLHAAANTASKLAVSVYGEEAV